MSLEIEFYLLTLYCKLWASYISSIVRILYSYPKCQTQNAQSFWFYNSIFSPYNANFGHFIFYNEFVYVSLVLLCAPVCFTLVFFSFGSFNNAKDILLFQFLSRLIFRLIKWLHGPPVNIYVAYHWKRLKPRWTCSTLTLLAELQLTSRRNWLLHHLFTHICGWFSFVYFYSFILRE